MKQRKIKEVLNWGPNNQSEQVSYLGEEIQKEIV